MRIRHSAECDSCKSNTQGAVRSFFRYQVEVKQHFLDIWGFGGASSYLFYITRKDKRRCTIIGWGLLEIKKTRGRETIQNFKSSRNYATRDKTFQGINIINRVIFHYFERTLFSKVLLASASGDLNFIIRDVVAFVAS